MERRIFGRRAIALAMVACGAISSAGHAAVLSDSQLFYNPDGFWNGFFPSRSLAQGGQTQFLPSGSRTIVGANVLPTLEDGFYPSGYSYSQSDYSVQPNQYDSFGMPLGRTYRADLTAGVLTTQFDADGLYHVKVNYSDGTSDIHSVFVDTGIGDGFVGADAAHGTATTKKVSAKAADLFIVSTGKDNDGFINNAITQLGTGDNVKRAATVAEAKAAIEARSRALGRKISVAIVGHGFQGSIRLGKDGDPAAERINNTGGANTTSGTAFGNMIKDFASSVNLFGCSTGGGVAGGRLLADIQGTGVNATAYTGTVYLSKTEWSVDSWATKVPTPGTTALAAMGLVLVARRRRG